MKTKPEPWPKVWTLSKSVIASLYKTGVLILNNHYLTKAEVRRLYVRLSGIYKD